MLSLPLSLFAFQVSKYQEFVIACFSWKERVFLESTYFGVLLVFEGVQADFIVKVSGISFAPRQQKSIQGCFTMSGKFTAYVYEKDLRKIQELVQPHPNIETGGDLFGLWQDERTVIIQRFIGPGEKCKRTPTSFHQDVEYLHRVGSLITAEEGLCNVGEWHSHHQIGMPQPSGADRRTVFSNMPQLGLERFVLFIATIEKASNPGKKRSQEVKLDEIKLRPFLFIDSQQKVLEGNKIKDLPQGYRPFKL